MTPVVKRAVRIVAEIAFFAIAIPIAIALADTWYEWLVAILLALAAVWELFSYVTVHPVEFANRISFGERVPIQEGGILKEKTSRKLPWEEVEFFDHQVANHQGDVEVVTATGSSSTAPKGRGVVKLKFTYQSRPNANVGDARGRLRFREMSASVVEQGINDRIESELITIAVVTSLDDFLGSKEALEVIARAVVELPIMPHEDRDLLNKLGVAYPITADKSLEFYANPKNKDVIRQDRFNHPDFKNLPSPVEEYFGIDVTQFMLTSVLPSDAVKAALESERRAEALKASMDVFKEDFPDSPEERKRLALAASGISEVTQLDVSGSSGATPIALIQPQKKGKS